MTRSGWYVQAWLSALLAFFAIIDAGILHRVNEGTFGILVAIYVRPLGDAPPPSNP